MLNAYIKNQKSTNFLYCFHQKNRTTHINQISVTRVPHCCVCKKLAKRL